MEIYQLLKKDHDEVKKLFSQIEESDESEAREIFDQLQQELSIHMKLEEKLFYPRIQENDEAHDLALEAIEEHNVAKKLLKEFSAVTEHDRWMAKLKVTKEIISQHIKEEEGEIFRKAKSFIEKQEAQEIGSRFEKEKEKQMAGAR